MNKLYWNLRRSLPNNKYKTVYTYTKQKNPNLYPSNKWGYGYWVNRGKYNEL